MQEIRVLQNNIIRILNYNKKFNHVTPLYKKLNSLKFDDIYKLELAKFMYLLQQSSFPLASLTNLLKLNKFMIMMQDKQVNLFITFLNFQNQCRKIIYYSELQNYGEN